MTAGDFNADQKLDLAVANVNSNNVSILLGEGSGGFTPASPISFPSGAGPASVAVGDFNGDQQLDLITANLTANNASVFLGDGKGGFTISAPSPIMAGTSPLGVAVGDFNLDLKPDFALSNNTSNNVFVYLNMAR